MKFPLIITSNGKAWNNQLNIRKQNIIAKYLSTPAGRATLAAAMIQPIRRKLDYHRIII